MIRQRGRSESMRDHVRGISRHMDNRVSCRTYIYISVLWKYRVEIRQEGHNLLRRLPKSPGSQHLTN